MSRDGTVEGKDAEDAGPPLRLNVTTAAGDIGASHSRPSGCAHLGESCGSSCAAKPSPDEPDALITHVRIRRSPGARDRFKPPGHLQPPMHELKCYTTSEAQAQRFCLPSIHIYSNELWFGRPLFRQEI